MKYPLILCIPLALASCSTEPEKEPVTQSMESASAIQGGEEIYMLYCAQCHGATGDGNGVLKHDRPARSFIDGGYSFGNTVHAIAKTTAFGIPGTPMPPFIDMLSAEQMESVAAYIRNFAPTLAEASEDEKEMIVTDSPLVARGMLPAINPTLKLHPRGIVIGNPDRFSYEYRVDDVRLLSVRQGRFVLRADWGERGGAPLELLGRVVVLVDNGDPDGLFTTKDGEALHAKLKSTNTMHDYGEISYNLVAQDGRVVAQVMETCRTTTGTRALIEQVFDIQANESVLIHPPSNTDVSNAPLVPVGNHSFIITHAIYGGDSK